MLKLIFNIHLWEQYIRNQFIKQIELLYESIQNRLIPTFDNIEKEAEQISDEKWDSLCSSSHSPDIDPADLAERAREAGIDHYEMLSSIKQTLLNITAITLYHLFEQQIIFLLRRDVLHPSQENDPQLMKISVFRERLLKKGIDIYAFRSWDKVDELRVVSNSIKHGEGVSVTELRRKRPDMFKHPKLRNQPGIKTVPCATRPVYMPIAGDDIFVVQADISEFKNALVDFWNELIVTCTNYEEN
jgi:hypothetical protein